MIPAPWGWRLSSCKLASVNSHSLVPGRATANKPGPSVSRPLEFQEQLPCGNPEKVIERPGGLAFLKLCPKNIHPAGQHHPGALPLVKDKGNVALHFQDNPLLLPVFRVDGH